MLKSIAISEHTFRKLHVLAALHRQRPNTLAVEAIEAEIQDQIAVATPELASILGVNCGEESCGKELEERS